MSNIRKWPAVHESGLPFDGLDQVGLNCVLEQDGHGADSLEIFGRNRLAFAVIGDNETAQSRLEVSHARRQAQDGHDLRRHRDVEPGLSRSAVGRPAQAAHDAAELALIHVHNSAPYNTVDVDPEFIALVDVVVDHGGE